MSEQHAVRTSQDPIRVLKRWLSVAVVALVRLVRPVRFLHPLLPGKLRNMARYWSDEMLGLFVRSGGTRLYSDQPTIVSMPERVESKVAVEDPSLRLSEQQLRSFYENGFLGPIALCPPEEMRAMSAELSRQIETESSVYGFKTDRDRHLDCPPVLDLCTRPAMVERIAQLMGPDLVLWRSQVWHKPAHSAGTQWHHATTFTMGNRYLRPSLLPADLSEMFNITAWIAVDDVDRENGCLQFFAGSLYGPVAQIDLVSSSMQRGEHDYAKLACDIDTSRVVDMPLRAGEMVIFHERTMHCALPNASDRRRLGLNCRICKPSVTVYPDATEVDAWVFGQTWSLDKWRPLLLRGRDEYGVNDCVSVDSVRDEIARRPVPTGAVTDAA